MNLVISLAQMVTVPLCLVGWCWSVGWGISLVNIASEYPLNINKLKFYYIIADKQLKYEALLKHQKAKLEAETKLPEPVKLDVMSLEGHESF